MKKTVLERALTAAKQAIRLVEFDDGSRVLELVHGGRVLGLFPPADDENFFWTHPALASARSAELFFRSESWHNSGGDRTWLSPEMDVFLPDYPRLDRYVQPRALDPGKYREVRRGGTTLLRNELVLTLSRSGTRLRLEIQKSLEPSANPLRDAPQFDRRVRYAGYRLRTRLVLRGFAGDPAVELSAWNLLQLPHGGEMIIPTYGRQSATAFMGSLRGRDLRTGAAGLRWRMRGPGEHKIGLPARVCTGRMGYLVARSAGAWDLVVRHFHLEPSRVYPDAPWFAPRQTGYAVQACSVNSGLGAFSELEYHAPAVTPRGLRRVEDVSDVWAFRGHPAGIRRMAGALLGVTFKEPV